MHHHHHLRHHRRRRHYHRRRYHHHRRRRRRRRRHLLGLSLPGLFAFMDVCPYIFCSVVQHFSDRWNAFVH